MSLAFGVERFTLVAQEQQNLPYATFAGEPGRYALRGIELKTFGVTLESTSGSAGGERAFCCGAQTVMANPDEAGLVQLDCGGDTCLTISTQQVGCGLWCFVM